MQVKIGNTDVTAAVQESTYEVNQESHFESWVNANNVTMHTNPYKKVSGTFDMVFIPGLSMEYSTFLNLLTENTVGDVTSISLSVNNLDGALMNINAFVTVKMDPIRDLKNGYYYKRANIKVEEC